MKQYFTLDPFRAASSFFLSFLFFSFALFSVSLPISLSLSLSPKLLTEHCLHELHHKRSR